MFFFCAGSVTFCFSQKNVSKLPTVRPPTSAQGSPHACAAGKVAPTGERTGRLRCRSSKRFEKIAGNLLKFMLCDGLGNYVSAHSFLCQGHVNVAWLHSDIVRAGSSDNQSSLLLLMVTGFCIRESILSESTYTPPATFIDGNRLEFLLYRRTVFLICV